MLDLFNLIKGLLPYSITTSLSLAFMFALTILLLSRYKKEWINLLNSENIIAIRVFFLVFLLALPLISLAQTSSLTFNAFLFNYWWVFVIYLILEITLYLYKIFLRRSAKVPKWILTEIYQILTKRQNADGGFRVGASKSTPIELWCTAQALHGFTALGFDDISWITKATRTLKYYKSLEQSGEVLWANRKKNFLLIPATWALISLMELVDKEGLRDILKTLNHSEANEMILRGIRRLISLQLSSGGWAPTGNLDSNLRIFPSAMGVWALSVAVRKRDALDIKEPQLTRIMESLNEGIELLKSKYDTKNSMWDSNPTRKIYRRISGLTLIVYIALSAADIALSSLKDSNQFYSHQHSLHNWLDSIHSQIMTHIDYSLHRDIDDAETDGPYDNVIESSSNTFIPITFYDWLPTSMLAIYASKLTGRYIALKDGIREKRLTEMLIKNNSELSNWYTYRLAIILIASSETKARR